MDYFVILIIVFLGAEIGLRGWLLLSRRGTPRYKLEHLFTCPVSWTNKYSKTNYYKSHPYISFVKKMNCDSPRYPSNNLGYAGRNNFDSTQKRNYRIYVCGDSTVEQNDYDMTDPFDPDATWPDVMGKELFKITGIKVEVINAGVSAYTSIESLIDFQLRGLSLKPDMAIFHHNLTDAWLCQSVAGFRPDYTHNRRTVLFETWPRLPDFRFSYVYQYIKMRLSSSEAALLPYLTTSISFESCLELTPERFSTFKNNLRSFCIICEANSIIPVVSLFRFNKASVASPPGHNFNSGELNEFVALLEKNNAIIREVSEEFPSALLLDPGQFEEFHYRQEDWMHWSAPGIQLMGKRAAKQLVGAIEVSKRDVAPR